MLEIDESALVGLDHVSDFAIVRARPKDYKPKGIPKPKTDKQEYFIEAEDVAITEKIQELHKAIKESMRRSLVDAQTIGELLFEQKKRIKHGFFTTWVAEQVGLNTRTAQNYMLLYHYKEELARLEITSLADAYFVLRNQATPNEVIDADDSINSESKTQPISVSGDLDKMVLPKRKATGMFWDLDLSEERVQQMEQLGKHLRFYLPDVIKFLEDQSRLTNLRKSQDSCGHTPVSSVTKSPNLNRRPA